MAVAIQDTGFSRAVYILWGILLLVAGLFLWTRPGTTALVLVEIMAIFWIVGGIFDFIRAIADKPDYWGWMIAAAIIGIIAGLYILGNPMLGTYFTIQIAYILLAIYGIVAGILNIISGIRGDRSWGAIVVGIILIVLAGWLLFNWRSAIVVFLPVMSIFMIVGGIFSIIASFYVDKAGVVSTSAPATATTPAATAAPTETAAAKTEDKTDDNPPSEPAG
jgi:uncharacterized membrane protein HdeD (DUF308 family)